nr:hypothetical protein [Tanacetum cinerariifolium]
VPQDYDVSSAMPCLFIHVIYAISLSLYPFTECYAQPYFFSCLIRQRGVTIRVDGSSKNYKIFSEILNDFDRQDVIDLHRSINERYEITSPEGYDLLLWGDLKILFEPNEEDEVWRINRTTT